MESDKTPDRQPNIDFAQQYNASFPPPAVPNGRLHTVLLSVILAVVILLLMEQCGTQTYRSMEHIETANLISRMSPEIETDGFYVERKGDEYLIYATVHYLGEGEIHATFMPESSGGSEISYLGAQTFRRGEPARTAIVFRGALLSEGDDDYRSLTDLEVEVAVATGVFHESLENTTFGYRERELRESTRAERDALRDWAHQQYEAFLLEEAQAAAELDSDTEN
ncbi:hypothetical protein ACFSYH_08685 [Populibacterium corticicola]|uniref:Uncharacterized protein n=1 Tax=Populibacterium corticicola TaxID=1812826 RepID=A0ABW5XGY2_9MICO